MARQTLESLRQAQQDLQQRRTSLVARLITIRAALAESQAQCDKASVPYQGVHSCLRRLGGRMAWYLLLFMVPWSRLYGSARHTFSAVNIFLVLQVQADADAAAAALQQHQLNLQPGILRAGVLLLQLDAELQRYPSELVKLLEAQQLEGQGSGQGQGQGQPLSPQRAHPPAYSAALMPQPPASQGVSEWLQQQHASWPAAAVPGVRDSPELQGLTLSRLLSASPLHSPPRPDSMIVQPSSADSMRLAMTSLRRPLHSPHGKAGPLHRQGTDWDGGAKQRARPAGFSPERRSRSPSPGAKAYPWPSPRLNPRMATGGRVTSPELRKSGWGAQGAQEDVDGQLGQGWQDWRDGMSGRQLPPGVEPWVPPGPPDLGVSHHRNAQLAAGGAGLTVTTVWAAPVPSLGFVPDPWGTAGAGLQWERSKARVTQSKGSAALFVQARPRSRSRSRSPRPAGSRALNTASRAVNNAAGSPRYRHGPHHPASLAAAALTQPGMGGQGMMGLGDVPALGHLTQRIRQAMMPPLDAAEQMGSAAARIKGSGQHPAASAWQLPASQGAADLPQCSPPAQFPAPSLSSSSDGGDIVWPGGRMLSHQPALAVAPQVATVVGAQLPRATQVPTGPGAIKAQKQSSMHLNGEAPTVVASFMRSMQQREALQAVAGMADSHAAASHGQAVGAGIRGGNAGNREPGQRAALDSHEDGRGGRLEEGMQRLYQLRLARRVLMGVAALAVASRERQRQAEHLGIQARLRHALWEWRHNMRVLVAQARGVAAAALLRRCLEGWRSSTAHALMQKTLVQQHRHTSTTKSCRSALRAWHQWTMRKVCSRA